MRGEVGWEVQNTRNLKRAARHVGQSCIVYNRNNDYSCLKHTLIETFARMSVAGNEFSNSFWDRSEVHTDQQRRQAAGLDHGNVHLTLSGSLIAPLNSSGTHYCSDEVWKTPSN